MPDKDYDYQVKKATADINDLKQDIKEVKQDYRHNDSKQIDRIYELEKKVAVMEDKLNTIINNTAKTNKMIQQAIFGAIATGIIGGVITVVWRAIGVE